MKLWKENRIDQEYEKLIDDIVTEFLQSDYNKDVDNAFQSVVLFISAKDGLNSSIELLTKGELKEFDIEISKNRNLINYY